MFELFSHVSCANRCAWKPPETCPACASTKVEPFVLTPHDLSLRARIGAATYDRLYGPPPSARARHCLDCGRVWDL